jgi:hypothetical protein
MPELDFTIDGARPAAGPAVAFRLRVQVADRTPIHSVNLRCQVRVQPARRRYTPVEQKALLDLFGTPDRWGKTVRDLRWAAAGVTVPPFIGMTTVDLPVPCDRDPNQGATRYFEALDGGDVALLFLFSGTVFYEAIGVGEQVALIPWDREARYRMPAAIWKDLFAETVP